MPAPKAILRDIHDRGLNPGVAHKSLDANGRIKLRVRDAGVDTPETAKEIVAEVSAEVLNDVEVTVPASDEAVAEIEVSNEGAGSVKHQPEVTVVTAPTVKSARAKRVTTAT